MKDHKTALVFAGGGSLGANQVGMLRALVERGVTSWRCLLLLINSWTYCTLNWVNLRGNARGKTPSFY